MTSPSSDTSAETSLSESPGRRNELRHDSGEKTHPTVSEVVERCRGSLNAVGVVVKNRGSKYLSDIQPQTTCDIPNAIIYRNMWQSTADG